MAQPLDLRRQEFGLWTAIVLGETTAHGRFWKCQCRCGTEAEIHERALVEGRAHSCGCDAKPRKRDDPTGKQFGLYLVIKWLPDMHDSCHSRPFYLCKCVCGKINNVRAKHLRNGTVRQCRACAQYAVAIQEFKPRWYGHAFAYAIAPPSSPSRDMSVYCRCEICGAEFTRTLRKLRQSLARNWQISCGCLRRLRGFDKLQDKAEMILSARLHGDNLTTIARQLSCHRSSVKDHIQKHGLDVFVEYFQGEDVLITT